MRCSPLKAAASSNAFVAALLNLVQQLQGGSGRFLLADLLLLHR
jgi:hypothetical protein